MAGLLNPRKLSLPVRRVIGNELVQALRARRWVRHTRALANKTADFQVFGAHSSLRRRSEVVEDVEKYIPVIIMPDPRIDLPMLGVLLSGTAYEKAEREAGSDFMSLQFLIKNKAAAPFRVDTDQGSYRVRKVPNSGASEIALEALDTLVKHCLVVDVSPALAHAFEDALADAPGTHDVVGAASLLREQLGLEHNVT